MVGKIKSLTPGEFEQYVAELVRALDFAKHGTVHTKKRFAGVRQPGTYEIDVALELQLAAAINFTLIVECKNWSRPVDRPIVQKLAQTRDAISADKAAIASPVGFTKEASEVARTLGIALWVITLQEWIVEYANGGGGLNLQFIDKDRSRDWTTKPAKIGLVTWSSYLQTFPPEANLPHHLKWARFLSRFYKDGRVEIRDLLVKTILGIDESKWDLRPIYLRTIGGGSDGIGLEDN